MVAGEGLVFSLGQSSSVFAYECHFIWTSLNGDLSSKVVKSDYQKSIQFLFKALFDG